MEASKQIISGLLQAPNWYSDNVIDLDIPSGHYYYCAKNTIYKLNLNNLTYIDCWYIHQPKATCISIQKAVDGLIATAGLDKKVKIWERKRMMGIHGHHLKDITTLKWSNDNTILISGDKGGTIILYSINNQSHKIVNFRKKPITCMHVLQATNFEWLSIGYKDGMIILAKLFKDKNIIQIYSIHYHTDEIIKIEMLFNEFINKEYPILIASSLSQSVCLFKDISDVNNQPIIYNNIKKKNKKDGYITFELIKNDNQFIEILVSNASGQMYVWKPLVKQSSLFLKDSNLQHKRMIFSIKHFMFNQKQYIISYALDRKLILWDFNQPKIVISIDTLNSSVDDINFAIWDKSLAAIANHEDKIKIIKINKVNDNINISIVNSIWDNIISPVTKVLFHPEIENSLCYGTLDGKCGILFNVDKKKSRHCKLECNNKIQSQIINLQMVSKDWIIINNDVDQWLYELELDLKVNNNNNNNSNKMEYESKLDLLVSLSKNGDIQFYLLFNKQLNLQIQPKLLNIIDKYKQDANIKITHIQFINNQFFIIGYSNGATFMYIINQYHPCFSLIKNNTWLTCTAVTYDSTKLSMGFQNGNIIIMDINKFKNIHQPIFIPNIEPELDLNYHKEMITSLEFDKHTNHLLSSSIDGKAIIYDINKKLICNTLYPGFKSLLHCAKFVSNYNQFIIAGYEDCKVLMFDKQAINKFEEQVVDLQVKKKVKIYHTHELGSNIKFEDVIHKNIILDEPISTLQTSNYFKSLWQGQLIDSLHKLINNPQTKIDIDQWLLHLSLAPFVGQQYHFELLNKAALILDQDKNSDANLISTLYLYAGKIHLAIECLVQREKFKEAITIAENNDQGLLEGIYLKYSTYLISQENYIEAFKCLIKIQQYEQAIEALVLSKNVEHLKLATQCAHHWKLNGFLYCWWTYLNACDVIIKLEEFKQVSLQLENYDKEATGFLLWAALKAFLLKNSITVELESKLNQHGIVLEDEDNKLKNEDEIVLENEDEILLEEEEILKENVEIKLENEAKILKENEDEIVLDNEDEIGLQNKENIELHNENKIIRQNENEIILENEDEVNLDEQDDIQHNKNNNKKQSIIENEASTNMDNLLNENTMEKYILCLLEKKMTFLNHTLNDFYLKLNNNQICFKKHSYEFNNINQFLKRFYYANNDTMAKKIILLIQNLYKEKKF